MAEEINTQPEDISVAPEVGAAPEVDNTEQPSASEIKEDDPVLSAKTPEDLADIPDAQSATQQEPNDINQYKEPTVVESQEEPQSQVQKGEQITTGEYKTDLQTLSEDELKESFTENEQRFKNLSDKINSGQVVSGQERAEWDKLGDDRSKMLEELRNREINTDEFESEVDEKLRQEESNGEANTNSEKAENSAYRGISHEEMLRRMPEMEKAAREKIGEVRPGEIRTLDKRKDGATTTEEDGYQDASEQEETQDRSQPEGGNKAYFSEYGDNELERPRQPKPDTQPKEMEKFQLSSGGRENVAQRLQNGEPVDKELREKFMQDAETMLKNGQEMNPEFRDLYMQDLDQRVENDEAAPPPEIENAYKEWKEGQEENEGEINNEQTEAGNEALRLSNEESEELSGLRQEFKDAQENNTKFPPEKLQRIRELSEREKSFTDVESAKKRIIEGSATPEDFDLVENAELEKDAEREERNIDKEIEDVGTEIIRKLSEGENVSAEDYQKFNELMAERGLQNMGLDEEEAREVVKNSLTPELKGRLAQRETRQQQETRDRIQELMGLEMQLLSLPERLDKLQGNANRLKNRILQKQAWAGSISTQNNERSRKARMEIYPLYIQLANTNAEITKTKNAGRIFAAQYRDTMQYVRRKMGVTGLMQGVLEWSHAKVNNIEAELAMNYRVVEVASPF